MLLASFLIFIVTLSVKKEDPLPRDMSRQSLTHTWLRYENPKRSFTLEYPSDQLTPKEGDATEQNNLSFRSKDRDNLDSIQIDSTSVSASDIDAYFAQYPNWNKGAVGISKTTVAGERAVQQQDTATCAHCTMFLFIHNNILFTININLPINDIEYIRKSFSFVK